MVARIELRNARVRAVDGHSNTAQVNGTPTALDTSMEIDNLGEAAVIPPSCRFTVVGSEDLYTVQDQEAYAEAELDLNSATSGSGDLTIEGADATIAIAFDDSASDVLTSIEADANIEAGDFTVTGSGTSGDPFVIRAVGGDYEDVAVAMSFAQDTLDTAPAFTQTHDGGSTHEITFTPGFATGHVPSDDADITFTGRTLEAKVGDGNATFDENREFNYDLDRQDLDTVRKGDAQPVDWTLDFVWDFLTAVDGAETPTFKNALNKTGPASDWETSGDEECEVYAVDIEIEQEQPCGSAEIETVTIEETRWENFSHDLSEATVSASGRSNRELVTTTRRPNITVE